LQIKWDIKKKVYFRGCANCRAIVQLEGHKLKKLLMVNNGKL
jgi:hypothetical protein